MDVAAEVSLSPVFRAGVPRDTDFVADTWLRTYRDSAPIIRRIDEDRYRRAFLPLVAEILKRATLRVAASPVDPLVIYGYAVYEPRLVHMVFVRRSLRRMGLANQLLNALDLESADFSMVSQDFFQWMRHKWKLGEYRPFWLSKECTTNGS